MDTLRCNEKCHDLQRSFESKILRQSEYMAQVGEKRKESIDNIHRKIS
jgi:hypothetical protein